MTPFQLNRHAPAFERTRVNGQVAVPGFSRWFHARMTSPEWIAGHTVYEKNKRSFGLTLDHLPQIQSHLERFAAGRTVHLDALIQEGGDYVRRWCNPAPVVSVLDRVYKIRTEEANSTPER